MNQRTKSIIMWLLYALLFLGTMLIQTVLFGPKACTRSSTSAPTVWRRAG